MKIILIGGTGFIGRYVENELNSRGYDCIKAGRNKKNQICIDLLDINSLKNLFSSENPSLIINLAGTFTESSSSDLRVNSYGPQNLINAIKMSRQNPRLVHIASATEPRKASKRQSYESEYSKSKYLGTKIVRMAIEKGDVEAQIIRVHNCYGKGQPNDRFIADTSTKLINKKEVVLKYPNRIRDFCLVSEAAAKISDFATNFDSTPNVDSVEIGTGVGLSLSEAAIEISKILNVDSSLVVIPPFDILDLHQRQVAEIASHPMGKCEIEFKVGIYRTLKER